MVSSVSGVLGKMASGTSVGSWVRSGQVVISRHQVRGSSSSANVRRISSSVTTVRKIRPRKFHQTLEKHGVKFHAGVPDSLLREYAAYVTCVNPASHVLAANEGTAVATAAGYHLQSGEVPLVYLQNSGYGHLMNPLLSLCAPEVYKIPMLIMVGWRGQPGIGDEPQHDLLGEKIEKLFDVSSLKYKILPKDEAEMGKVLQEAMEHIKKKQEPFALLVQKDTFENFKHDSSNCYQHDAEMTREEALEIMLPYASKDFALVGTTGFLSREMLEIRGKTPELADSTDFLCVGSMGHAGAIAHGIAEAANHSSNAAGHSKKGVVCFDGDGAAVMHMGQFALSGSYKSSTGFKYIHILVNNGIQESAGGPTAKLQNLSTDFAGVAESCNYEKVFRDISTKRELKEAMTELSAPALDGISTVFMEVKVKPGHRKDLMRPEKTPEETKIAFMQSNFGIQGIAGGQKLEGNLRLQPSCTTDIYNRGQALDNSVGDARRKSLPILRHLLRIFLAACVGNLFVDQSAYCEFMLE